MTGGVLFIVGIGVVLGIVSGSFMLAVIFIIRHRYNCIQGDPKKLLACKIFLSYLSHSAVNLTIIEDPTTP